jgi:hypothetical protein
MRAWVLHGMLSGVAGALLAFWLGTISPTNFFLAPTFAVIVMLIVGGMRTVSGAVLGAGVVTLVQDLALEHEERSVPLGLFTIHRLTGLTQLVLVALILLVMYVRRDGLLGSRELDELLGRIYFDPSWGPNAPRSAGALRTRLNAIRKQGYATQDEELTRGLRSIAGPVRGPNGSVVAAVNIAVPSSELTMKAIVSQLRAPLLAACEDISRRLGA